jgi:hypothetical protein
MEYTEEELEIVKDTHYLAGIWMAFQYIRDELEIDLTDSDLAKEVADKLGF